MLKKQTQNRWHSRGRIGHFLSGCLSFLLAALLVIGSVSCSASAPTRKTTPTAWTKEGPNKETPEQHDQRMAWFREARFGMFIHWGLYAIPAGVWKGKEVPANNGEWIMQRAGIPVDEYKPLAGQFNPVRFDARQWVRIAKNAGMKYIVITSKHHDGFSLFDSKLTDYDIVDATPFKRDVMKELAQACRDEGIKLCFYHSIMDWYRPEQKNDFPTYKKFLFGQVRELLTNYGPIGIMWYDGEWIKQWDREHGRELEDLCHLLQPNVIVNNRVGKRHREDGDYGTPEQFIPATGIPGHDWEACMTMNKTWGFKKNDHKWKSEKDLIHKLIDIAGKGGNFLLNVGPTADGLIPQPSVERLAAMGRWMKINSESIYGTTAGVFRYLPWGRCTRKGNHLYLHVFDWPTDGKLTVPGLLSRPKRAYLLADTSRKSLNTKRMGDDLVIDVPAAAPDSIAGVVVLKVTGAIRVDNIIRPLADGSVRLGAADAITHGKRVEYHIGHGIRFGDFIHKWSRPDDWVSWQFKADKPGTFDVVVNASCDKGAGGSKYVLSLAGQKITAKTKTTGSARKFKNEKIGSVTISKPGEYALSIKPENIAKDTLMTLRAVILKPQK